MEEMAPGAIPQKEGAAAACGCRRRAAWLAVLPRRGPTAGSEEEGVCLLASSHKYFPRFPNAACHLPVVRKTCSLPPSKEGLGPDQGHSANQGYSRQKPGCQIPNLQPALCTALASPGAP